MKPMPFAVQVVVAEKNAASPFSPVDIAINGHGAWLIPVVDGNADGVESVADGSSFGGCTAVQCSDSGSDA
jgi:hypothetical protein